MATLASLLVVMGMDTKGLTAGAAKAEGTLGGLGASTTKFGALADKAFLGIGVAAVAGIAIAIKAGSDLNEQINKSEEVFEDASGSVQAFAKTAASSLGIAEEEALSAASNFGQLLEAAGFAEQAAADMSTQFVTLAADLGSFNNIPVDEALEKLRAGLAGQARPLRELGVFLSAARVEAEAYSSGIAKVGEELTDAQKIQARYNIIMEDTAKAQGDFARTLEESLPNQLKVVSAEVRNVAADLGIKLLPVVLDAAKAFHLIVPIVGVLADNLGLIFGVLVGWSALKFLPALLFQISLGLEAIGAGGVASGIGNTAGALAGLAGTATGLGVVAVGVGAIYLAMKLINGEAPTFAATLGTAAAEIVKTSDAIQPLEDHLIAMRQKAALAEHGITSLNGSMEAAVAGAIRTGEALSEAAKTIQDGLVAEIPEIRGTITTYKETFTLSPGDLVKITASWAKIARTIASDLRAIGKSDLEPAVREAISALPPEMRHAWVEGNDKQRAAIEQSIMTTFKIEDQIPGLAKQALTGGREVGAAFADGIGSSIAAGSSSIAVAASQAVQAAIVAARAAADAHSPSRLMERLGEDLMSGLHIGIANGTKGGPLGPAVVSTGYVAGLAATGGGGGITINAGALLGTKEEVLDWIRQGLVAAGRSGKGHH